MRCVGAGAVSATVDVEAVSVVVELHPASHANKMTERVTRTCQL
jgi:hypothetical protein